MGQYYVLTLATDAEGKWRRLHGGSDFERRKAQLRMVVAEERLEVLQVLKLLQCVRNNDKDQVQKLIENGVEGLVNLNEPNEGQCALNLAAEANNLEMTKFLLDLGAHPNVSDFKGRTAVMRAAEYGHVQVMEELVKAGSDLKLTDDEGKGEKSVNFGVVKFGFFRCFILLHMPDCSSYQMHRCRLGKWQ